MNCRLLTVLLLTLLFVFQHPAIGKCSGGKPKGDVFRNWTLNKLPSFTTAQINSIGTILPNIHFTDGQVVGFGGCNHLRGGKYSIRKDKIKLDNIAASRKMCIGIEADVEREFIPLLNKADHFIIDGKKLVIYTTDNKEMEFIAK